MGAWVLNAKWAPGYYMTCVAHDNAWWLYHTMAHWVLQCNMVMLGLACACCMFFVDFHRFSSNFLSTFVDFSMVFADFLSMVGGFFVDLGLIFVGIFNHFF